MRFENSYEKNLQGGRNFRRPGLVLASGLYTLAVLLLTFGGSRVQQQDYYLGALVTEFLFIAFPPVILLFLFRYDVRQVMRLNKPGLLNLLLVFLMMVFSLPVVGALNLLNLLLIKQVFGRVIVQQLPVASDAAGLLVSVLVIAGSAGFCEELLFRGVIQRGFERMGVLASILIPAFLFGMLHLDFQKLLGTFLLGALIGFIVYRTDSLFAGMFAHFTNNAVAVLLSYGASKLQRAMGDLGVGEVGSGGDTDQYLSSLLNMSGSQRVVTLLVWTVVFLGCVSVLAGLLIGFVKNTGRRSESIKRQHNGIGYLGLLLLIPGLLVIALQYVSQAFHMLGIQNGFITSALQFIGLG